MSSVDPENSEEGQDNDARAEELKNTANQFFKGSHHTLHKLLSQWMERVAQNRRAVIPLIDCVWFHCSWNHYDPLYGRGILYEVARGMGSPTGQVCGFVYA